MHVLQSLWSKGFKHVVETSKTFWNFCIWSNDIFPRFYFVSSFYHQKLDAKGVKSFGLCSLVQKLLMMWPKTFGFLVKKTFGFKSFWFLGLWSLVQTHWSKSSWSFGLWTLVHLRTICFLAWGSGQKACVPKKLGSKAFGPWAVNFWSAPNAFSSLAFGLCSKCFWSKSICCFGIWPLVQTPLAYRHLFLSSKAFGPKGFNPLAFGLWSKG